MRKSSLLDLKISAFTGIEENIDPFANKNAVLKSTNLLAHDKPGILTNRPEYLLKYETPVDDLDRLDGIVPISFDNFYEKVSSNGVEVTIQVQRAQIKSPANVTGVSYVLNSPIFWMRPYYNGVYWEDKWMWLNETIITKIITASHATYKNQIVIQGNHGNLIQYTAINVTKNVNEPVSILEYEEGASNTTVWISNFNNAWQVNDIIVLMKNYIPLKYLPEMYNVDQREISFHRLPSKLRIGFGGKLNRIGIGIEFVDNVLQMADYNFTNVAPELVGNEFLFASTKRMILQPYTVINEESLSFKLSIQASTGHFAAGNYYFRMTAVLDDTNEILVCEQIYSALALKEFFPIPSFRSGSFGNRITKFKVYFGEDNSTGAIDYYLFKEYLVRKKSTSIDEANWILGDDGYFTYHQLPTIGVNIYNEVSAAAPSRDNDIGSFFVIGSYPLFSSDFSEIVVDGTTPNFYIMNRAKVTVPNIFMGLLLNSTTLDVALKSNTTYNIAFTHKASVAGMMQLNFVKVTTIDGVTTYDYNTGTEIKEFPVSTSDGTVSFEITTPDLSSYTNNDILMFSFWFRTNLDAYGAVVSLAIGEGYELYGLTIEELQTNYIDTTTELGALDITEMGYTPTFNLVKDWQCALVMKGSTFVGAGFIEKKYSNLVFFSPISGYGNPQYDVLIAGKFLDSDKDNFRGESIIAMAQLLNTQLFTITENGGVIISPDTGETQEVGQGYGILTKDSLRNYRGTLYWGSLEDFVKMAPDTGYVPIPIDENSVRGYYKRCPDKTLISACIDQYGSYHVSIGETSEVRELILTARGWFDLDRLHYPMIFRNGFMGLVWFMDKLGNIYSNPSMLSEDVGYADIYGDYRSGW